MNPEHGHLRHNDVKIEPQPTDPQGVEHMAQPPFVLELVGPDHPDFGAAEALEAKIFFRTFNNTAELMEQEYGPYREASKFLVVKDQTQNRIAGIVRLITNSPAGFKSLNDLEQEPWDQDYRQVLANTGVQLDPATTVDIATLGIDEGYRTKDNPEAGAWVNLALYRGICQYSAEHKIDNWVAILDDKVLELVQALGEPMLPYAGVESAAYLDSASSTPVWADYHQYAERLKQDRPNIYALLIRGEGMEQSVSLPPSL